MNNTLLILMLFLLSCGSQTKESIVNSEGEFTKLVSKNEDFSVFFKSFNSDTSFQKAHIQFPLIDEFWEIGDDKPTSSSLESRHWQPFQLEYKEEYSKREIDAYSQKLTMFTDSAKVEMRGIDNGIHIDYVFYQRNESWVLVLKRDYSS